MQLEVKIAIEDEALEGGILELGEPSIFACPECHGVLLQLKEGSNLRFRCHTGHGYSIETLLAEFGEKTEDALWNAIRAIEENILLLRRMASQLSGHDHERAAQAMLKKAEEAHQRAELVRKAVLTHENVGTARALAGLAA
jgi:two-component system chemotaxis response regulator CheB